MQRKVQSSWLLCYLFFGLELSVWSQEGGDDSGAGEVVTVERVVDRAPKGSQWVRATRGDRVVWKERIRTGELSRAAIEISTGGVLRISELTSFELRPPPSDVPSGKSSINFASGVAYFFSRTEEEADIETPTASLSIRGTEFVVEVGDNGETTVSMVDGEVEMSNELGRISLINGEQGIALLQELTLSLDWNSSTGLFGRLEGNWYKQDLEGVTDASGAILESDPFIQTNLSLGYRFNDNNAQVSLSALNLFNQDYELSPLNPFLDLPRQRTFVVQCRWNF